MIEDTKASEAVVVPLDTFIIESTMADAPLPTEIVVMIRGLTVTGKLA